MQEKRKVVKHGPSTLTISLPASWTKQHGVQQGDQLHVDSTGNGLVITTNKIVGKGSATASFTNERILWKTITSLYRNGYDEITVEYERSDQLEKLHRIVDTDCIGFEIVDETPSHAVIKKVSDPSEEEFSGMFRRIFHYLKTIADEGLLAAQEHNLVMFEKLILMDKSVDKLSNFCRRVASQHGYKEYEGSPALYHIIEQLEKIGDVYRDLNKYLAEQETMLSDEELTLYAEANRMFNEYTDLFFTFSLKKANSLRIRYLKFRETSTDVEDTATHPRAVYLIEHIVREVYNLLTCTLMLNL